MMKFKTCIQSDILDLIKLYRKTCADMINLKNKLELQILSPTEITIQMEVLGNIKKQLESLGGILYSIVLSANEDPKIREDVGDIILIDIQTTLDEAANLLKQNGMPTNYTRTDKK